MDTSPRQLAAVWFADIAGYTSLSNRDESAALRLVGIFHEVAREQIEGNGGTVVKFVGDGVLAYAPSITSATASVLSLRGVFKDRSAQAGIESHLRIGMHLGDIAISPDGDVFGDGVNIASRLEAAAGPGHIYVSEDLWRQCRQRAELEFIPLGPRHLKGVEDPVWVYELAPPATDPVSTHDEEAGRQTTNSLAILPFDVLGSGDDVVFLAAGIHNDLLTELTRNPSLTVISRTSVMAYRQSDKSIPRIAHELNVGWIVEGAVQSAGNRVRLSVQLIDGMTDVHRWADYFDREVTTESLFEIQTELTEQISESLHAEFARSGSQEAAGPATNSMEAYRLMIEGRMQFDRKTEEGLARARELFQRAVDLDPEYAPAWVGLTDSLAMTADYGYGDRESLLDAANAAVQKALELMPDSAEAHTSLGLIAEGEHDAPKALREYEKAMRLGPSYADPHSWHGWVSLVVGRGQRALQSVSRSVELNPLSAEAVSNLALCHLALGDPESAIVEARRAGELSLGYTTAAYYVALAQYDMGRFDEVVTTLTPLSLAVNGELAVSWASMMPDAALAIAHVRTGDQAEAEEVLATIDAESYPFEAALVHAAMGDSESAFDQFARAEHAPYGPALAFHHHFRDIWKELRDDPRYLDIVDLVYRSWKMDPPAGDAAAPWGRSGSAVKVGEGLTRGRLVDSARLSDSIHGEVLSPGDSGFDEARSLWNVRFDRKPDLIARCTSHDDVVEAVAYARDDGVELSVKGGGHNYAAKTVAEGGLLIDLSAMKSIEVDLEARTARIGPGVTGAELDTATQEYGLAVPIPTVSSVGVVGAALGGGTGYLSRKYGITADNVISIDAVTADGRSVTASEDENPDLFWAIRGGGGNFAVATSMLLGLHKVGPEVLAGQIIYPFDEAASHLRSFREFMEAAPREFQCYPFTFRAPPIDLFPEEFHGQPVLDFVFYHEDPNAADEMQPLRELGEKVLDFIGPTPYVDVQKSFDANLPKGQRYYSKAHDLEGLTDGAIDTMVEFVPRMAGGLSAAYFDPAGGAVGDVAVTATPYAGRTTRYGFHILAGWSEESEDEAVMSWASDFHTAMAAHATGGVYVNLIADDEADRVAAAYGDNYARLIELKQKWDPTNVFSNNYNISPG